MDGQPSLQNSRPPNIFAEGQLRDSNLEHLPTQHSMSSSPAGSQSVLPQSSTPSSGYSSRADSRASLSIPDHLSGVTSPPTSSSSLRHSNESNESMGIDDGSGESDADTEMADARSNFDETSNIDRDPIDQRVQNQQPVFKDVLSSVTNLFRLLDLVDEHGSGGIVEKVVIDQISLHRVLNIVQPGSYDSVSKINFKALDNLVIKPTGLYGNRSEIVKYLRQAQYLDEHSAALISQAIGPVDSNVNLRSGLYLVLDPNHKTLGPSKNGYIVYWPEDTTWDDQAASSSVRRNRVTFMRYLTKLADQMIALVSPSQAGAFVWDTSAHNKDLPEDQQDNDDDSRLFSFEVSKSLEQEEDAVGSSGFTVTVESKLLPRDKASSRIRLVPGEQKMAMLTVTYEKEQPQEKIFEENINALNLRRMISSKECPLQLGDLKPADLDALASNGLRESHRGIFEAHERRLRNLSDDRAASKRDDDRFIEDRVTQDKPKIRDEIRNAVRVIYARTYPSLEFGYDMGHGPEVSAELHNKYSGLGKLEGEILKKHKLDHVQDKQYQVLKSQWLLIEECLDNNTNLSRPEQDDLINDVLNGTTSHVDHKSTSNDKPTGSVIGGFIASGVSTVRGLLGRGDNHQDTAPKLQSSSRSNASRQLPDPVFVAHIHSMNESRPALSELLQKIQRRLGQNLEAIEKKVLDDQLARIISGERLRQNTAATGARDAAYNQGKEQSFQRLMAELKRGMLSNAPTIRHVNWVRKVDRPAFYGYQTSGDQFRWSGTVTSLRPAQNRFSIYPLELTEQDSHLCRADESHVPQPKLEIRHRFEFTLPKGRSVGFIQLIRDKCLVITSDADRTRIFIEDNVTLSHSINTTHGKVSLSHDSLGGSKCKFALDQGTRLLAIVHGQKEDLKLSIYIFDELFTNLRSRGSPIPLKNWYNQPVDISTMCFVSGLEEVCLIETSGRVRIFSLVTQQFRTASLQIDRPIIDAFSAPDGSCLLVAVADEHTPTLHQLLAFHWASFGTNKKGIKSASLAPCDGYRTATRLEGRGRVHVVSFNGDTKAISSTVLHITQKATEFSFRSDHEQARISAAETVNNSLIDCHLEVWTRFPVVPAVARNTLAAINRQPRQLVFLSPIALDEVGEYFARMISTFETTTRKPMGGSLSAIEVKSIDSNGISGNLFNQTSEFKMGSFIVELLCLIPLHLAVTRENRFIPLKDGVWDPDYERSLLGADVPAIIDALSLGWYESLFQSYMAKKPVRVVSSMVTCLSYVGKSYCLNHFADTSFAGSAMRTTEGVWLSCTPTEKYLLVSLDFEGVHSIERSAQEDALLVLFNTAISNLVLFRNNFAMSRDIAGLFTSFQSSATVLDPNVNRGLFNSTLAIIIKDVTNADSKDIVKEFSLKFQAIVEKERDQNFISRLHRGKIQIIPWPVINSPGFYTLFNSLHRRLDQQPFTHTSGGAFLHNLKTLMAKIKTSDWGSLDQNLAAHRAQQMMERLPNALCYGRDDEGPLKNMDTDEELPTPNQMPPLFVPEFSGANATENEVLAEQALQSLIHICGPAVHTRYQIPDTSYIEVLQTRLHEILDERLSLVQRWTGVNIERFPAGNQDIRNLTAKLNTAALAMRAAVKLCASGCSECRLLCLRAHRHSGEHSCGTNHRCVASCEVAEEHSQREPCGLPAGHGGRHMCNVKAHSCGRECSLSAMGGCVQSCIKPLGHEDEHICSARAHLCGKPCDLRNVRQGIHRALYSCPGTCNAP
ncbi:putative cytochrome P450 family protein, partial [Rhizoctonia solani 123E]